MEKRKDEGLQRSQMKDSDKLERDIDIPSLDFPASPNTVSGIYTPFAHPIGTRTFLPLRKGGFEHITFVTKQRYQVRAASDRVCDVSVRGSARLPGLAFDLPESALSASIRQVTRLPAGGGVFRASFVAIINIISSNLRLKVCPVEGDLVVVYPVNGEMDHISDSFAASFSSHHERNSKTTVLFQTTASKRKALSTSVMKHSLFRCVLSIACVQSGR